MSALAIAPEDKALSLILSSLKDLSISASSEKPSVSQLTLSNNDIISGSNTIASHLSTLVPLFAKTKYTDLETAEIDQWLTLSAASPIPTETIEALNDNLKFRTTLLGDKFSIADVAVYARIKDQVSSWTDEQKTGEKGYRYIVRWVDFVQNSPELGLQIPDEQKVKVDTGNVLVHLKPEEAPKKEKKEGEQAEGKGKKATGKSGAVEKVAEETKKGAEKVKEGAHKAAAAVGLEGKQNKREKKEKPKREAPKKEEVLLSPSQIDLRIGHILHCAPHPNADSLFVSIIAMGDSPDSPLVTPPAELSLPTAILSAHEPLPPVRTICSGLNGYVPIESMQLRKVVCVANLKPVTMRGIKSAGMVLAASPFKSGEEGNHKKEIVELIVPPVDATAGEKVYFEGYKGTPESVLNPKKKIWEGIQPGFTTTDTLEVVFDRAKAGWVGEAEAGKALGEGLSGRLVTESGGVCKAQTLIGAAVS